MTQSLTGTPLLPLKMHSLFSVMLLLRPDRDGQISQYAGYLAHAAFLDLLRQADPELSKTLHDLNGRKPFTLSTLLEPGGTTSVSAANLNMPVRSDRLYRLRLTSLEASLFNTFISRFMNLDSAGLKVRLGDLDFQVARIEGSSEGEWIGRSSFESLAQLNPARGWTFNFSSPTAFSLGEQDWGGRKFIMFPEPGYVFDSLVNYWNDFAPPVLTPVDPKELRAYTDKYLAVSGHQLHTGLINFKQHQQLGFLGTVSFKIMEKQPSPRMTAILTSLAAFALYAGVGYKTSMGMGQARCVAKQALPGTRSAPAEGARR